MAALWQKESLIEGVNVLRIMICQLGVVSPYASARIGRINGAISIAPMIVAELFTIKPKEAINAANAKTIQNRKVNAEPEFCL